MPTRTIDITIQGNRYTLRSDESEEHLGRVAEVVDQSFHEVTGGKGSSSFHTAILAAMNIASDLVKLEQQHEDVRKEIDSKTRSLIELIDERMTVSGRY